MDRIQKRNIAGPDQYSSGEGEFIIVFFFGSNQQKRSCDPGTVSDRS